MDGPSERLTKLQIHSALGQRATRVAVLIVECIHLAVDLIDEQSPAIDEALLEHFEKIIREDQKSLRCPLRKCLLEYTKKALIESRKRERRLYTASLGTIQTSHHPKQPGRRYEFRALH
jgi:hypothetical protein